ncbi:MAG: hypothetical protein DHS20C14_19470 [Phycisphaeraceae bacterium]|nr:MAG: hypothetical protein DHS20C14_19470 [Phycisphaeraceae bacterium]
MLGWLSIVLVIALNWIGMIFAAYVYREARAGMQLVRSGDIRDTGARQIRAAYWTSMLAVIGGALATVVLVALVIIATSVD